MASNKCVHANVLDAALKYVADNITNIFVISTSLNVNLWTCISANHLASTSMFSSNGNFGYIFTVAAAASGRKVTVPAVVDMDILKDGSAYGVALINNVASDDAKILYVTSCTTKALTSGDKVNVPTWEIQLTDPA